MPAGKIGYIPGEDKVNKTSDVTGGLIYDSKEDEGYNIKNRDVQI